MITAVAEAKRAIGGKGGSRMYRRLLRRTAKFLSLDRFYERLAVMASPFRGVYNTWDEARQSIPRNGMVGFNHPEAAPMYLEFAHKVRLSDYPALFWLKLATVESASLLDLGGNIGLECYSFERYLNYGNTSGGLSATSPRSYAMDDNWLTNER